MGEIRHAGLIARYGPGGWRAALIEGPSGCGKSDLALRCLEAGLRLVADDRTRVWACGGRLFGACPPAIGGLIEARGVGILPQSTRAIAIMPSIKPTVTPSSLSHSVKVEFFSRQSSL